MRICLLFILLTGVSGCGSDRVATYPVFGRLQFEDGIPVRNGTIELESLEFGTTATGTIQHDGSFVLGTYTADDGAAAGDHRAIVVQIVVADGTFKHTVDHGRPVPTKFGDYEQSPLMITIHPEQKNDVVVTLSTTK